MHGSPNVPGVLLLIASFVAIGSLAPAGVAAHGGPPSARRVAFHPLDSDTLYIQATFGLVVSRDRGRTWSLVCEEAVGWQVTENPQIVPTTDDAVVYGLFKGLHRSTTALCGAELARADLENVPIVSLDRDANDAHRVLAVTGIGAEENGVYVSSDDGIRWDPSGDRFAIGDVPAEVRVAPSDPRTVYVSGSRLDPALGFVARSEDGGQTWRQYDVALDGAFTLVLGAVDPTDARRLLAYLPNFDAPDKLLLSENGGESWEEVATVNGDLTAVAFAPDGSRVWYGGYEKGLNVSNDGGRTFAPQRVDLAIRCLVAREGELWVCADNYADGFAVGVSTDGGDSFEPRFIYEELAGQIECGEGTRSAEVCPIAWRAIMEIFGLDGGMTEPEPDAGRPTADGGPDAGAARDAGPPSPMDASVEADAATTPTGDDDGDGCGCAVIGSPSSGSPGAFAWLLSLLLVVLRARRRYHRAWPRS